jgi:hypothetical protein
MQTNRNQSRTVPCRLLCVTGLLVLAVVPQAFSQTGGVYDLTWHTNDGGGTTSATGGAYSLGGTIGQPDAGAASGGAYALTGGFWGIANLPPPAAPIPSQVFSRKLHNSVPFDINLPLTGNVGIECRSGGASNDYQVLLTFAAAVTFNSASITSGTGSVSSASGSGTTTVTVNLTGVTNTQRITITLVGLSNASGTGDLGVPMGVLLGDTNGDGFVNAGDSIQTRNRSGQAADAANFRSDVNADGFVNSGDATAVRSRSGTLLP